MSYRIIIVGLLFSFIVSEADAQHRHRRRGALLGGLAGAAIGAAIGNKGNNETTGALVGGAVGAIAGGTIGDQRDQRIHHNHRYHSGHYYTTPHSQHGYRNVGPAYPVYRQPVGPYPATAGPATAGVTTADVIQMQHRGLSEMTMIRLIQTHGIAVKPTVAEVIDMHEYGVSERVIAAMQGQVVHETDYTVPGVEPYGPSVVAPRNRG
jgi:hypothetical protein